jgi:hypothetical protein
MGRIHVNGDQAINGLAPFSNEATKRKPADFEHGALFRRIVLGLMYNTLAAKSRIGGPATIPYMEAELNARNVESTGKFWPVRCYGGL